MKKIFVIFCLLMATLSISQSDDLPFVKEHMNSYLDSKLEKIQQAKDCVMYAESSSEVEDCHHKLEENPEDRNHRIQENKNF